MRLISLSLTTDMKLATEQSVKKEEAQWRRRHTANKMSVRSDRYVVAQGDDVRRYRFSRWATEADDLEMLRLTEALNNSDK